MDKPYRHAAPDRNTIARDAVIAYLIASPRAGTSTLFEQLRAQHGYRFPQGFHRFLAAMVALGYISRQRSGTEYQYQVTDLGMASVQSVPAEYIRPTAVVWRGEGQSIYKAVSPAMVALVAQVRSLVMQQLEDLGYVLVMRDPIGHYRIALIVVCEVFDVEPDKVVGTTHVSRLSREYADARCVLIAVLRRAMRWGTDRIIERVPVKADAVRASMSKFDRLYPTDKDFTAKVQQVLDTLGFVPEQNTKTWKKV